MLNESIITSLELAYKRNELRHIWFQQDGAPAHRRITVKDKLREGFGQRVLATYIYQQVYLPELLERVSAGEILEAPATYRSASISKSSHL